MANNYIGGSSTTNRPPHLSPHHRADELDLETAEDIINNVINSNNNNGEILDEQYPYQHYYLTQQQQQQSDANNNMPTYYNDDYQPDTTPVPETAIINDNNVSAMAMGAMMPTSDDSSQQPSAAKRVTKPASRTKSAPPAMSRANNPSGPVGPKFNFRAEMIEFLSQKIHVSYLIVLAVIIGGTLLLIAVGLGAGLGAQHAKCAGIYSAASYAAEESSRLSATGDGQPGKRSVTYEPDKPWTNFRLPRSILPLNYVIDLRPHFYTDDEAYFTGRVEIETRVVSATRYVIVHAKAINITAVTVRYLEIVNPPNIEVKQTFPFEHFQYFVIELSDSLFENRSISIELEFNGSLTNTFEGFYKAPFRLPGSGQKLYTVMTQFEPLAARRAFPCFDEPNLKAYFTIIVHHKAHVTALSNMPLDSKEVVVTENDDLPIMSRFRKTNVPMSTYIVAFVVGPYATTPNCRLTNFAMPICAYAPEYLAPQTGFALDTAIRGIEWLQDFFGFPYPLPKFDMVVYPEFRSMAMENWGLATFREEAILVSSESTEEDKDVVTSVIMHELSHQWFGNLVTMDWWDDLWLNEGFASYMEFPSSWSVGRLTNGDDYVDFLRSISRDSGETTRQIRVLDIQTGDDISAAFDAVTYLKGSAIIRMLVSTLGFEKFRAGIRHYMQRYQYRNAHTADLWASLSKFSSIDVAAAMNTWVEQKGYPLVTLEMATNDQRQMTLRQERFVLPQWKRDKNQSSVTVISQSDNTNLVTVPARWYIPIVYREIGQINTTTEWFPPSGLPFTIDLKKLNGKLEDLKINADQAAFIRVNYPIGVWNRFGDRLLANIDTFSPVDRAGLVDDSLELAKAGRLPYRTVMHFLRFMSKETHPIVWDAITDHLTFLRYALSDSPFYGPFENLLIGIVRSARLTTLNSVASSATKMRTLSLLATTSLLAKRKEEIDCYSEYYRKQTWHDPRNIELRRAVFLGQMLSDDSEENIVELLHVANRSSVKQVKKNIHFAITRTRHIWIIAREMEKVFTGELRPPDFLTLVLYAGNSPANRQFMWNWVRENFAKLKPLFGGPTRNLMSWVTDIASYFNTKTQYEEFETFVKSVGNFGAGERAKNNVLEKIRINIYWRNKLRKEAEAALVLTSDFIKSLSDTPVAC